MKSRGNAASNSIFERTMNPQQKPNPKTDRHFFHLLFVASNKHRQSRESFIIQKYKQKVYIAKPIENSPTPLLPAKVGDN